MVSVTRMVVNRRVRYAREKSTETARNVIFRLFLARAHEDGSGFIEFDELAQIHERGEVGYPRGLLHVVRHDGDGVIAFQFVDEFFDFGGGNGVQRRGRLVQQYDFWLDCNRPRNAQTLLLSTGKRQAVLLQFVLDLAPQCGFFKRPFNPIIHCALRHALVQPHPKRNVLVNRHGERRRLLEHHADLGAHQVHVLGFVEQVLAVEQYLAFGEVALSAYVAHKFNSAEIEPGLKEGAFHDPSNFVFPAGVHICEVEIDQDTGVTTVANYVAVDDFGNIINPMIVEGQVHGGIAQGIGQALTEGCVYDKQSGQLLTGSYMDYCMPRAADLPSFKLGFTCTPCPSNPLGMKGCGEAGAIASPAAVMNAMTDALGVKDLAMPATPQVVWKTMQPAKMAAE